jgi:hypothetical protein
MNDLLVLARVISRSRKGRRMTLARIDTRPIAPQVLANATVSERATSRDFSAHGQRGMPLAAIGIHRGE